MLLKFNLFNNFIYIVAVSDFMRLQTPAACWWLSIWLFKDLSCCQNLIIELARTFLWILSYLFLIDCRDVGSGTQKKFFSHVFKFWKQRNNSKKRMSLYVLNVIFVTVESLARCYTRNLQMSCSEHSAKNSFWRTKDNTFGDGFNTLLKKT